MSGLLHSVFGLAACSGQALLHLRATNPYLDASLAGRQGGGAWSLPRQAAPAPAGGQALATGAILPADFAACAASPAASPALLNYISTIYLLISFSATINSARFLTTQ